MITPSEIDALLAIIKNPEIASNLRQDALQTLLNNEEKVIQYLKADFDKTQLYNLTDSVSNKDNSYSKILSDINNNDVITTEEDSIFPAKKNLYKVISVISSIAAILLVILLINHHSPNDKVNNTPTLATNISTTSDWDTIINSKSSSQKIQLRDSSIVWLEPNSRLICQSNFPLENKILHLQGSAKFSVKKDPKKPFTIIQNGVEIKDLGTIFSIKQKGKKVTVHLFKGKVVVRPDYIHQTSKSIVLSPGHTIIVNTTDHRYEYQSYDSEVKSDTIIKKNTTINSTIDIHTITLAESVEFHNTPIDSVLQRISSMVGNTIQYENIKDKKVFFTGKFVKGTPLLPVLKILSKQCNIDYTITKNSIQIIEK